MISCLPVSAAPHSRVPLAPKRRITSSRLTNRELTEARPETLFVCDSNGYLIGTNEPWPEPGSPPPLLYVTWSAAAVLYRFRAGVGPAVERACRSFLDRMEPGTDPRLAAHIAGLTAILTRVHGPVAVECGPAFRFPEQGPHEPDVVAIGTEHASLLHEDLRGWSADLGYAQPCRAIMDDSRVVSLCATVRCGPAAREAGATTVTGFRGRGYARRVVAAWATAVRRNGAVPLYSTDWTNAASRGVARALGLVRYGVDLSFTEPAEDRSVV